MLSGRDDKLDSKFDEVVSALTYDGFGNRLSESRSGNTSAGGPNPSTTSYTYDANNRVVSSSAGEAWVYDANGNTTSQTSRDGSTSTTAFNAANRSTTSSSTSASDGKTTTSSSTYDAAGNVTSSRVDGDGFGFTEVIQRDIRYQEVRKDITQSWAKGAARLEGATSFSYDANGNLAFLDRGRKQGAGQNSVAYFDYDLEGQIIGRADKASALTNAAFFAGYSSDPDAVAASGDGESGFSYFNPSETQNVQRQLFGDQFSSSASTSLQNYLYANNKPISQATGNQALALKKLTLQGGQPIQTPPDPITGEQAASTGSRLLIQEGDIKRTAGVIDRTVTARNIAARAYKGDPGNPGFAQLSLAAQDKVVAYVQSQLPPDAQLVAGAQVELHSFILMVDASYTGLSQITDYSLRQLGSDGIPGGSVQSHVVRAGDTLQTVAQIYFGSPAYWYLIADANGLSGSEALAEGVTLTIPNQVANSANSAQTFKVYNESEVIGSTSPEIRTVAKKKKWYQTLIQILIIVILVIAVIVTAGAALAIAGAATPGLLALGASLATSLGAVGLAGGAAFAAAAAIGAAVYAGASIITQGLAVAAGLQDEFSWKAVGKAAVTGAVSGGAGFLAAPLAGANAYSASNVALRVGIEAGKQVILDGKITNVAGLVGAAAAGGAFKDMGESGSALQAAGNFASNNSATFGAGLALLESKVRGQGNNAMQWVALATAAAFDSGALSAGGDQPDKTGVASRATSPQYFTSGGELNWRVVAAQAIGTAIVSNRMGGEAAIGYFGNAVAEFAVQAGGRAMDARVAVRASAAASRAGYDQAVEAFSNPGSVDRSADVLLAAGPGYSGMGGTSGKSQREQNIERMMRMANEPEAMGSASAFRVEINGTSTTTSADVPMNAGSSSASMFPNSQVTGSGFTSDGRPYYDWDSGATTIGIPPGPDIVGTPLEALAVEGSGLRLGSLAQGRANGQAYYNGLIANADNPYTAIGATYGRAFSNAGYDLADGAAGLYALATDSNVQARVLNAVGDALAHPLDTTAAAYSAGERYLTSTSGGQMAEDVLRFGAGGAATLGIGRGATSLGGAAEAAGAAMKGTTGLRSSASISAERAEAFMIKSGMSADRAADFVSSFDGQISARLVRPGEGFIRYTDNANSTGSFLTKTKFDNPVAAIDGLYLGPYGNSASFAQSVTSVSRSIVLEGGVANGGVGVRQSLVINRNAFQFGTGGRY